MRSLQTAFLVCVVAISPLAAKHWAVEKAEHAVESGDLDPERDLLPLVQTLAESRDADERRRMVDAIGDIAADDSDSPNAAKSYLHDKATPVLLDVIVTGNEHFLQGAAVSALRGMRAPRSILEQAATLAEADANEYVQSRGEILRGFISSMPIEDEGKTRRSVDPEKARIAIAYLDKRGITLSTHALREAARRADPETVQALLEAGIAPDTGVTKLADTPLYYATFSACSSQGAETDWLVETVQLLVDAGADVTLEDEVQNTVMTHAANQCGPKIIGVLAKAGADVNPRNRSGFSPLALALLMKNFDTAEALIENGARLSSEEKEMLSTSVEGDRAKSLFAKASGG